VIRARSALNARKVWSARVVCKPRAGGRGAPARGLQRAHCTPGGPPTQELSRSLLAWACSARTRGRSRALPSSGTTAQRRRPGTGRP